MDDDSVSEDSRLRLLILYVLHRGGILDGDIHKLHAHALLPPHDREVINNLVLLGARVTKALKENTSRPAAIFPAKTPAGPLEDEVSLSRYETALHSMLEELVQGTLDPNIFPPTKPNMEGNGLGVDTAAQQTSLRTANKPTWARTRPVADENRQRILVFMAGGATYAESRACYEVSQHASKDIILMTSHMLTPRLFLHQLGGLNVDKRRLDIPSNRPPPKAPAHLFERAPSTQPLGLPGQQPRTGMQPAAAAAATTPPTSAMNNLGLHSRADDITAHSQGSFNPALPSTPAAGAGGVVGKLKKSKDGEEGRKKKHHFFR